MGLKLNSLRQIQSVPPSEDVRDDDTVVVMVKLAKGAKAPDYVNVREHFGPEIVSAEVTGRDLSRLHDDPAVLSFQRSEQMPLIR